MKQTDFEKRIAELKALSHHSDSEESFLNSVGRQINSLESEMTRAKKKIAEIDLRAYRRISGKMLQEEESERKAMQKILGDNPGKIKSLKRKRTEFYDEYQSLLSKKESALETVNNAKLALDVAEAELTVSRRSHDFDLIVASEKKCLLARKTVEAAESVFNEAEQAVRNFVPKWSKYTDQLFADIDSDTRTELKKILEQAVKVLKTGIERKNAVIETEKLFVNGDDDFTQSLLFDFHVGWMIRNINEIERMEG